eukprot:278072_1
MFCTISNQSCTHPVISKKTGHIFEKSLLEKHLKIHKTCPITSEPMSIEDVIEIQNNKLPSQPKQISTSSIPSLLNTFQNEWDELMLESYNLKKKLQDTRQQLSHSMYQYDAAIRVIARLTQERDHAFQELANTRESMASALAQVETMKQLHLEKNNNNNKMENDDNNKNQNDMDIDGDDEQKKDDTSDNNNKLSEELVSKITLTALDLAKMRKKETKKPPLSLVSMDIISKEYSICNNLSYSCHSSTDKGINCIDICDINGINRIISGGNDSQIIVYNIKTKEFEYVLKGHNKKINDILFNKSNKNIILSASSDNTCIIWKLLENGKYEKLWNMNNMHKNSVISLSQHPINEYFLSCSCDGLWCFNSLIKQKTILKLWNNDLNVGFNTMELHPDGQILATGCNDKKLKIWDIRTNQIGYTFNLNNENISCINFNENGYYLGAGHLGGIVNIWDLRKIGKNKDKQFLKQINVENKIKSIKFDRSGQYLGVGQPNGILLYLSKKWNKFAQFKCHNKDVNDIQFTKDAKYIITASADSNIKILSNNDTI